MRFATIVLLLVVSGLVGQELKQDPNTWVKRSPLPSAPLSPMLGYEGSFGYDPVAKRVIRWAGHNQGGGGEQNAETWTFDPATAHWELKEPNLSPPGVCCAQQNVFDPANGRFLRFKGFSGNHGWMWFREIYLGNTSVWNYNLATNTWRPSRPVPEPAMASLRCVSWDSDRDVAVVFGGEGNSEGTLVYDPYMNTWTRMNPPVQPAFRSAGNMAYDSKRKRHILFGTQFTDDPHTWAYDLAKNEWTDLKPKAMPPTNRNDAVLAYDERNDTIVASVNAADKFDGDSPINGRYETWLYDGDQNTWKHVKSAIEPPGSGSRRRIMTYVPDQNCVLMENYVNPPQKVADVDREQQIWTYRVGDAPPVKPASKRARKEPPVVEDVIASVKSATEVTLHWPKGKDAVSYHIERAPVEVFSEDEIDRLRKDTPPLAEPSVGALKAIGKFERVTKEPFKETTWTDTSIDLSKPFAVESPLWKHRFRPDQLNAQGKPYRFAVYAYRIRAVNKDGVEGGDGPYALTIPSSPQWLFSKEDGDACHLKWAANREQNLQGYRVYRMESPRVNGPGQKTTRVTAAPLKQAEFVDEKIGPLTRRYWIVAVDALGQDGFTSAPTWHYRQYRSHYIPFTGEWHQ